jgi:short-subunit dehydrogenase
VVESPPAVVIVGAGPGLGLAVARRFRSQGYAVGLISRDEQRLRGLAGQVDADPSASATAAADVADERSLRQALGAIRDRLGDPRVLVFNPSLHVPGPPTRTAYSDYLHAFRVGAAGLLVCAQEVAPAMRAAGRGTILATGSTIARHPSAEFGTLSMEKAALRVLTLSLAEELAPEGVHVAMVSIAGTIGAPGFEPERIADRHWALHTQPPEEWVNEVVHDG